MGEEKRGHTPPGELLDVVGNLAEFHREHEKFYSMAPLRQAADIQAAPKIIRIR